MLRDIPASATHVIPQEIQTHSISGVAAQGSNHPKPRLPGSCPPGSFWPAGSWQVLDMLDLQPEMDQPFLHVALCL